MELIQNSVNKALSYDEYRILVVANKYLTGFDIGLKLRNLFPKVKIIVATQINNNCRLLNILKKLKPNSLIIKSELDSQGLIDTISHMIYDIPFYSKSILKLMRQYISNDYNLDDIDRKILDLLSNGVKTKEIPEIISLSLPGVERRKKRLNEIFNNPRSSDKLLLKRAKENGYI